MVLTSPSDMMDNRSPALSQFHALNKLDDVKSESEETVKSMTFISPEINSNEFFSTVSAEVQFTNLQGYTDIHLYLY
jgi:hypothetical protein